MSKARQLPSELVRVCGNGKVPYAGSLIATFEWLPFVQFGYLDCKKRKRKSCHTGACLLPLHCWFGTPWKLTWKPNSERPPLSLSFLNSLARATQCCRFQTSTEIAKLIFRVRRQSRGRCPSNFFLSLCSQHCLLTCNLQCSVSEIMHWIQEYMCTLKYNDK